MKNLNRKRLEGLIRWYEGRTSKTANGGSTYELTLQALELLRRADSGVGHPRFDRVNLDSDEKEQPEPIKLTERQAQVLHMINGQRELVNPSTSGNVRIIDSLIELGALSAWRELTCEGKLALASFAAHAKA